MKEPVQALLHPAAEALKPLGLSLRERGWTAELVVFAPGQLDRWPDQCVIALVVPLTAGHHAA